MSNDCDGHVNVGLVFIAVDSRLVKAAGSYSFSFSRFSREGVHRYVHAANTVTTTELDLNA